MAHDALFRSPDSQPISGDPFRLLLTKFVLDEVIEQLSPKRRGYSERTAIKLPLQPLSELLKDAEAEQELEDSGTNEEGSTSRPLTRVHWKLNASNDDNHIGHRSDKSYNVGSALRSKKRSTDLCSTGCKLCGRVRSRSRSRDREVG